jgi:hypothetical protein
LATIKEVLMGLEVEEDCPLSLALNLPVKSAGGLERMKMLLAVPLLLMKSAPMESDVVSHDRPTVYGDSTRKWWVVGTHSM